VSQLRQFDFTYRMGHDVDQLPVSTCHCTNELNVSRWWQYR